MGIIIRLTLSMLLSVVGIFFATIWFDTVDYLLNRKEYEEKFALPYKLHFDYFDYIDGGLVVCDDDGSVFLSSGSITGTQQVGIKRLTNYTVLPNKIVFSALDSLNNKHFFSINQFHTVVNVDSNILNRLSTDSWLEISDVYRWLRFKYSWAQFYFGWFTLFLSILLLLNIIFVSKTVKYIRQRYIGR